MKRNPLDSIRHVDSSRWSRLESANPVPNPLLTGDDLQTLWSTVEAKVDSIPGPVRAYRPGPGHLHPRALLAPVVALLVLGSAGVALADQQGWLPLSHQPPHESAVESVAEVVTSYATTHPGSGYTNVIVNGQDGSVRVVWHGAVPKLLRRELAARPDVRVSYVIAKFPARRLSAATQQLLTSQASAVMARDNIALNELGPAGDGSGLRIGYEPIVAATPVSVARVQQVIAELTGVPATQVFRAAAGVAAVATRPSS